MESHLRHICFCDVPLHHLFREILPEEFGSPNRELSTGYLAQSRADRGNS